MQPTVEFTLRLETEFSKSLKSRIQTPGQVFGRSEFPPVPDNCKVKIKCWTFSRLCLGGGQQR